MAEHLIRGCLTVWDFGRFALVFEWDQQLRFHPDRVGLCQESGIEHHTPCRIKLVALGHLHSGPTQQSVGVMDLSQVGTGIS